MHASTFMRLCTVWLDSETCSRARRGESTLGERCSRTQRDVICFATVFTYSFNVSGKLIGGRSITGTDVAELSGRTSSDIHAAITRVSVRFKGQLWRDAKVPVSMSSFCCSSHKQFEASHIIGGHVHARDSVSCFAEVLSSVLQCLVSVTRSEVLRDGSIDNSAIHCPRGQVLTHVANLNCPFAPSHWLFRGSVSILDPLIRISALPQVGQRVLPNRHRNRKMMTLS